MRESLSFLSWELDLRGVFEEVLWETSFSAQILSRFEGIFLRTVRFLNILQVEIEAFSQILTKYSLLGQVKGFKSVKLKFKIYFKSPKVNHLLLPFNSEIGKKLIGKSADFSKINQTNSFFHTHKILTGTSN